MEKQTVIVQAGALQLPYEMQRTLGLEDGSLLTVSVRDGGIFLLPESEPISAIAAGEALQRLRSGFSEIPEHNDPVDQLRQEWEERLERFCA